MLAEKIKERFGSVIAAVGNALGEESIVIAREDAIATLRALRDESRFSFNMLSDLTAVDWLERTPRFDIVYNLNSLTHGHRLRVKVQIGGGDEAWMPTAIELWKAADWLERECYDMFGIIFRGHPDLRRILLYDSFEGHPLRKDYPYQRRQPIVPETDAVINPVRSSR